MKSDRQFDISRFYSGASRSEKHSMQRGLTSNSCSRDAKTYRWVENYSYVSSTLLGKRMGVFKNQKSTLVPNIMALTYGVSSSNPDEQVSELITQI